MLTTIRFLVYGTIQKNDSPPVKALLEVSLTTEGCATRIQVTEVPSEHSSIGDILIEGELR